MNPKVFAFPLQSVDPHGNPMSPDEGLTTREYFAAQALSGMIARQDLASLCHADFPYAVAAESVRIADALISELAKEVQP